MGAPRTFLAVLLPASFEAAAELNIALWIRTERAENPDRLLIHRKANHVQRQA